MLNEIANKEEMCEIDYIHLLTIILRANNEIEYMSCKNKIIKAFELNQMYGFRVILNKNKILLNYKGKKLILNIKELSKLSDYIYNYLQSNYPIKYDYHNFDPIYMSLFLYKFIPRIKKIKYDMFNIKDFRLLRSKSHPVTLEESESYKALNKGKECEVYTPFNSNHIVDSDYERLLESLNSVTTNKYPYLNQYIIVYNDEPYIRDGQHRASVLKYLYGNISIPIMRIYIEGELKDD